MVRKLLIRERSMSGQAVKLSIIASSILLSACQGHVSTQSDSSGIGHDFLPDKITLEREPSRDHDLMSLGGDVNADGANRDIKLIPGENRGVSVLPQAKTSKSTWTKKGGGIRLNFSNTSVQDAAQLVLGDLLGAEFVVDSDVSGLVSFNGQGGLHQDDLIPTLKVLLSSIDAKLIERESGYQIVKGADKRIVQSTKDLDLIPLRYMSAESFAKVLASHGVTASVVENGNMVAINESANRLRQIRRLSETFDVNWFKGQSVGFYPIENASAEQLQNDIIALFGAGKGNRIGSLRIIPVPRNNSVMVVAPSQNAVQEVGRWIAELDGDAGEVNQGFYVYRVRNGKAVDLAKLASDMFDANQPVTELDGDEVVRGAKSFVLAKPPAGRLRIIADEATNSVIVSGNPYHFSQVRKAMKQLDTEPMQVLVEARIMELSLTGELQYGLEWFLRGSRSDSNTSGSLDFNQIGADLPIPGFNYVIERAGEIRTVLNAFADDSRLKVLSSPSLLVLNNRTARIQVGDEVPIPRVQSTSNFTPDAPTVNSIEYRDTGILLEVTPRINVGGMVTLEVSQEVSSVGRNTVSNIDAPIIQQRRLSSTIAVQNGQTVVLGGLIQERESTSDAGIPVLKNIPGLGKLFSTTTRNTRRTELVALLTPRVIERQADFVQINADYIESFQGLKEIVTD